MVTIENCPETLNYKSPDYATLDGVRLEIENIDESLTRTLANTCPTLVSIGLLDALLEVEGVLSWNETEKHPNAKWKMKSLTWHDSKAVNHLNQAQCGSPIDTETKRSHRAHAACRLLMSLQKELQNDS